jgi:hypothetical protein
VYEVHGLPAHAILKEVFDVAEAASVGGLPTTILPDSRLSARLKKILMA